MHRREFLSAAVALASSLPASAQPAKIPHVGMLVPGPPGAFPAETDPFTLRLRELGYRDGQNVVIERVYGDWRQERFAALAAELVDRKVDVIVVISTSPAGAAKDASATIPIVVAAMADPVEDGLVANLARPGGNLTGNTFLGPELIAKRFGLLKEIVPRLSRVAALLHANAYGGQTMSRMVADAEAAARGLGLQLQLVAARSPSEIEDAFAVMVRENADALIQLPSPMLYREHKRIAALAERHRLPGIYAAREFVEDGGLMSYGADLADLFRRAADYVDKILKGAKVGDLPVEQPTKFELVINSRAAKALDLVVPPILLSQADEVIE